MPNIDLSKYNIDQLESLAKDVQIEIDHKREAQKQRVLEEMTRLAAEIGLTPEEVFGESKRKSKRVKPKYQNPDNLKQTWSGRGKQPAWIQELLAKGKELPELLIAA
jgi:DNA-binding protein H-NS